jgi:hypothetical protein
MDTAVSRNPDDFRRVDVGAYDTQTNLLTAGSPRPQENENVFISGNASMSSNTSNAIRRNFIRTDSSIFSE